MNFAKLFQSKSISRESSQLNPAEQVRLQGLLAGFNLSGLLSRRGMEIVGLKRHETVAKVASPVEHLKLIKVPSYGTMVLRNECEDLPMIVPMHIGFFQHGAQNHATSRALVFGPGEERTIKDGFCVQAAQGGLLKSAEQRFLMLPNGLRAAALKKRNTEEYDRLWADIDSHNRAYGVAKGGHLERFLRPNFHRLLPMRHGFEMEQGQTGGAYFVRNQLVGIEIAPSESYFADVFPILSIYCFGPEVLAAEREGLKDHGFRANLDSLTGLDDLRRRMNDSRKQHLDARSNTIEVLSGKKWRSKKCEHRKGFSVSTIETEGWIGQAVKQGDQLVYLSIFRDSALNTNEN